MNPTDAFTRTFILKHCEPFNPKKLGLCLWYISANRLYVDYFNASSRQRIDPLPFRDFAIILKEVLPCIKSFKWDENGPLYFDNIRYFTDRLSGNLILDEPRRPWVKYTNF